MFDPTTGTTWTRADGAGWVRKAIASSPPTWALPPAVSTVSDLPIVPVEEYGFPAKLQPFGVRIVQASRLMPRMTYDRERGRAVMLYADGTWEWDGANWSTILPRNHTWSAERIHGYVRGTHQS
jgi:hypothetical protein